MAGRYIINQTAGKRYIILEEDAEKIEGGYFDTEGVWHDLSGPLEGDLLGKYVINETGGKRIILLEEDADEIGGGYFEEDGTWVPFGDNGIEVNTDEIIVGVLAATPPNYYSSSTTRLCYPLFDLFLEPGSKYRFDFETENAPDAELNVQLYNTFAYEKVQNSQNYVGGNTTEYNWLSSGAEITVDEKIGQYDTKGVRFSFRKDASNSTVTENFVTSLKITKVEE